MAVRQYRLSEPPSWPLRALLITALGMATASWFIVPTTLAGGTAPLVPALALQAAFLGSVVAAVMTSPEELQDGIIAIVAAGATAVLLFVLAQAVVGDVTHPITSALLALVVGIGGTLVATVPAFGMHFFGGGSGGLGTIE